MVFNDFKLFFRTLDGVFKTIYFRIRIRAKAYRLEEPDLTVEKKNISDSDAEVNRFEDAIERSKKELEIIKNHALKELGEDKALYLLQALSMHGF